MATATETYEADATVRKVDISNEGRLVFDLQRDGDRNPRTYSLWKNEDGVSDDMYARAQQLKRETRVHIWWKDKPMDRGAGVFHNITAIGNTGSNGTPAASESVVDRSERTREELADRRPAPRGDSREDGMAYGAAQHAASRVLAAWAVSHGQAPDKDEEQELLDALRSMTDQAFRNRLPL